MALVIKDRVKESSTTTGTGAFSLAGAGAGFVGFSTIGDGNTTYYAIVSQTPGEWEVGVGTYTASGSTLSRDSVLASSNSGSLVDFTAGVKDVFVTYPADRAVATDLTQTLTNKTIDITSNTLTGVAPLASPTFTGIPAAPTAAAATNTTQLANTAFVFAERTNTATLTNKTAEKLILNDGYTEEVFAITDGTVSLNPNNGSIQTWTLGANRTPNQTSWAAGQSITLMVDDGTSRTLTWTTLGVVWTTDGGTAPVLNSSGFTVIVLWKVGTTIYGARVGDA
jgi:hypothetical protein